MTCDDQPAGTSRGTSSGGARETCFAPPLASRRASPARRAASMTPPTSIRAAAIFSTLSRPSSSSASTVARPTRSPWRASARATFTAPPPGRKRMPPEGDGRSASFHRVSPAQITSNRLTPPRSETIRAACIRSSLPHPAWGSALGFEPSCRISRVSEEEAEVIVIEGREVRVTHPSKLYFSRDVRLSKLELVRYYLSVAGRRSRWRARPAAGAQAIRERCRGRGLLPEAGPRQAAAMAAHRDARVPFRSHGRGDRRGRRRGPRVDREPRVHRAARAPRDERATSITRTSCAWTSIRVRASSGPTCGASLSR